MATAVEVLPLARAKLELAIDFPHDDRLLTEQIASAVDWAFAQTGHNLLDTDAATVPPGYVAAVVLVLRRLYDGILTTPATASVWALLSPYRNIPFPDASSTPTPIPTPAQILPRFYGWVTSQSVSASDLLLFSPQLTDALVVPPGGPAFSFFARPQSVGYPTSLTLDGTPFNQINAYMRQLSVIQFDLTNYLIGISNQMQSTILVGRTITLS